MLRLSWRPYLFLLLFLCLANHLHTSDVGTNELVYIGYSADMKLGGKALWIDDLLSLTNGPGGTSGHAFCSYPLNFQNHSGGPISSFSTTFVFIMGFKHYKGSGLITFMLSSTDDLPDDSANTSGDLLALADWVRGAWQGGSIVDAIDPELRDYNTAEVELVLKLGLLCSHSRSKSRPCMRLVMLYLEGGARLADFHPASLVADGREGEEIDQAVCTSPATMVTILSGR